MKYYSFYALMAMVLFCSLTAKAQTIRYVNTAQPSSGNGVGWSTAYQTLNEALNEANTGTGSYVINVAEGTYYPGGTAANTNRDTSYVILRGGIQILGGYNNTTFARTPDNTPTVLSGAIGTASIADNIRHLMIIAGLPATADSILIDGLTFSAATGLDTNTRTYNGIQVTANSGAALHLNSNQNIIKIRNCVFNGNRALYGGAVYCNNSTHSFFNCTFISNGANTGGAFWNTQVTGELDICRFTGNVSSTYGGAIESSSPGLSVVRCTFTGNKAQYGGAIDNTADASLIVNACSFDRDSSTSGGGAIMIRSNAAPTSALIVNSDFSGNVSISNSSSADGGAIFCSGALPFIVNCSFKANKATSGAAIMFTNNALGAKVINCLFSGNAAARGGAAIVNYGTNTGISNCTFAGNKCSTTDNVRGTIHNAHGSSSTISNCILWGNTDSIQNLNDGYANSATVSYSIIQGGYAGTGNRNTDPLFVNPEASINAPTTAGDYHLQVCSPAINTGSNALIPGSGSDFDLDQNPRIWNNGIVDMGAYEYQANGGSAPVTVTLSLCSQELPATWNGIIIPANAVSNPAFASVNDISENGCDSATILNLVINRINTQINQSGSTLSAAQTGAAYQWIACPENTPVAGATAASFTPAANGSYAAIITLNGCSDTSACTEITTAGISEAAADNGLMAYPVPAQHQVVLSSHSDLRHATLHVYTMTGALMETFRNLSGNEVTLNLERYPAGIYFLELQNNNSIRRIRIVKQ